jgi:D-aminopeptidase
VGVLVQTNFGGILTMDGAPVRPRARPLLVPGRAVARGARDQDGGDGSIMMVRSRPTRRSRPSTSSVSPSERSWGSRAPARPRRTASGDYVIAFSTSADVRRVRGADVRTVADLSNDAISGLFQGVVEATGGSDSNNSLLKATT